MSWYSGGTLYKLNDFHIHLPWYLHTTPRHFTYKEVLKKYYGDTILFYMYHGKTMEFLEVPQSDM